MQCETMLAQGGGANPAGPRATRLGEHDGSGGEPKPAGPRATRLGEHDGSGGERKPAGSPATRLGEHDGVRCLASARGSLGRHARVHRGEMPRGPVQCVAEGRQSAALSALLIGRRYGC